MDSILYRNKYIKYKNKYLNNFKHKYLIRGGGELDLHSVENIHNSILLMLKKCDENYLETKEIYSIANDISLLQLKMNMSRKKINIKNESLLFDSTFLTNESYEFLYSLFLYINYSLIKNKLDNETISKSEKEKIILSQLYLDINNLKLLQNQLTINKSENSIIFENEEKYNSRLEYINKLFNVNIIFLQEFNIYEKYKFPQYNFYYYQESQKAAVIGINNEFKTTVKIEEIKYKNFGVCHSENIKEKLFDNQEDKQIFDLIYNLCGKNLELFTILKINNIYYVSLQRTNCEYYDNEDKINQLFISIKSLPIQFIISGDLNISYDLFVKFLEKHKKTNYSNLRIQTETINVNDFDEYLTKFEMDKSKYPHIQLIEKLGIQFKTPQPTVYAIITNIEEKSNVPSFMIR